MQIVRKRWAFQTGYDIGTDLPFGFQLYLFPRAESKPGERAYRVTLFAQWDWPKFVWRSATWAVNEENMVRGMPVRRPEPLCQWRPWKTVDADRYYWTSATWPRCFFWDVS
jgi:hypothetical protein